MLNIPFKRPQLRVTADRVCISWDRSAVVLKENWSRLKRFFLQPFYVDLV